MVRGAGSWGGSARRSSAVGPAGGTNPNRRRAAVGHRSQGRDLPPGGGRPDEGGEGEHLQLRATVGGERARQAGAARRPVRTIEQGERVRPPQQHRPRDAAGHGVAGRCRDDPRPDHAEHRRQERTFPELPATVTTPTRSIRWANDSAAVYSSTTRRSAAASCRRWSATRHGEPARPPRPPGPGGPRSPPGSAGRTPARPAPRPGRGVETVGGALQQPAGERQLLQVGDRRPRTADDAVPAGRVPVHSPPTATPAATSAAATGCTVRSTATRTSCTHP